MPKYAELKCELRKAGCYPIDNSKHQHWYSPITKTTFQISHHDREEVAPGTEHSIRKQSGVKKKR